MSKPLKVFMLEDRRNDQELVKRQVLKHNSESIFAIAKDKDSFHEKIKWFSPDIILADYHLPDFTGMDALLYVKKHLPDVPFLFVTGTLNNEEAAAEVVLRGADGYLIKDNLSNLPVLLESVLTKNEERIRRKELKAQEQRENLLSLEKIQALIDQDAGFTYKAEIKSLLKALKKRIERPVS